MNYKVIYAIYDTEEKCFVSYNHKAAWTSVGNAKNAYTQHQPYRNAHTFAEQTRYVIHRIEAPL